MSDSDLHQDDGGDDLIGHGRRAAHAGAAPVESLAGSGKDEVSAEADTSRHVDIVLLGLMASGKSSVGLTVANELSRPFVDSDSIVALRTGDRPAALERRAGERELHDAEAEAARRVLQLQDGVVFAAAASAVESLTAEDLAAAWTVWLETTPAVLARRAADGRDRPLLADSPLEVLREQHRRRAPLGRRLADLVVDTDEASVAEVAATICIGWRSWAQRPRSRRPNG